MLRQWDRQPPNAASEIERAFAPQAPKMPFEMREPVRDKYLPALEEIMPVRADIGAAKALVGENGIVWGRVLPTNANCDRCQTLPLLIEARV
jgi:hypothetical protein